MARMTFLINDASTDPTQECPMVYVTISENPDGTLSFKVEIIGTYTATGELQGKISGG